MSKSNTTENDVVRFMFNAVAMPQYGSNLYVALHTADPGEAGLQNTTEANYTGYARVSVSRDGSGWTVSGSQASNAAEITFPECTGGSNTITYFSIGLAATGGSQILYSGELTAPINISNLITPRFPTGTLVIEEE